MKILKIFGKSKIFYLDEVFLRNIVKPQLIEALERKARSNREINEYLVAFDYFIENPSRYNGATIVRDLYVLKYRLDSGTYKLDPDAMLHDYEYIEKKANRNFIAKIKSDYKYFSNMLANGKGARIIRFVLLTLLTITVVYVVYNYIKHKKQ